MLELYFPCSRELCGVSAILRHFLPWPLKITHRKTGRPAAHQCSIQTSAPLAQRLTFTLLQLQTTNVTCATCRTQRFLHRSYGSAGITGKQQGSSVVQWAWSSGLRPLSGSFSSQTNTSSHCSEHTNVSLRDYSD